VVSELSKKYHVKYIVNKIISKTVKIIIVGAKLSITQDNNNQKSDPIHIARLLFAKILAYWFGLKLLRIYEIIVTSCNSFVNP